MHFTSHRYVTGALRLASAPPHASTLGEILQPEFLFKVTHVCRLGTPVDPRTVCTAVGF